MTKRTKAQQTRGQNQFHRGVSGGATPRTRYIGKRRASTVAKKAGQEAAKAQWWKDVLKTMAKSSAGEGSRKRVKKAQRKAERKVHASTMGKREYKKRTYPGTQIRISGR